MMREKKILRNIFQLVFLFTFMMLLGTSVPVHAQNLDEIQNYEITAEVREDARVHLDYHIEWKVLDSDSEGPLEWVKIGIANSHIDNLQAGSTDISDLSLDYDGGSYVRVDLNRAYYEGEVANIDFSLDQDYLYQIDQYEDGYTGYSFTPGWFDSLVIDKLTIRWKSDRVSSWNPDNLMKDGYYVWTTSLMEGETYTVNISYPNDAFGFSQEVSDRYEEVNMEGDFEWDDDWDSDWDSTGYYEEDPFDFVYSIMFILIAVIFFAGPFVMIFTGIAAAAKYNSGASFGGKTQTKITRTKVTYHTNCPNCGAPRPDGKDACDYCGTNLVKSEEILKEETLTPEEKKRYNSDGEFAYNSIPDTFIRVHTVHIPVTSSHTHSSGGRSSGSSRGGRSSGGCAHSSCACACASCACACACACAGGGRAGCSNKDFYNKSLKLNQLKLKKKQ